MAPTPAAKLQQAIVERTQVRATIERTKRWVDTKLSAATRYEAERRLELIESAFHTFNKCQSMIEQNDDTELAENGREEVEDMFFECCALIQTRLHIVHASENNSTAAQISASGTPPCQVKLPKIQPPTFSGDYSTWLTFYAKFKALVHDKPYDAVYKFETLRNCLDGIAAEQLRDMELTENNYQEAVEMIYRRWNNPKLISQAHMKNIFEAPAIKIPSSEAITNLINIIQSNIRALKSLGRPTTDWDDWIVYIILAKLDSDTKSKWDDTSSASDLPTLKDLFEFLEKRAQALRSVTSLPLSESVVKKTSFAKQQQNRKADSHFASSASLTCNFCSNKGHSIDVCRKFQKLPIPERRKEIKQKNLCWNCLSKDHSMYNCKNNKCSICNGSHHKLLHDNPAPGTSSANSYMAQRNTVKSYCLLSTAIIEIKNKHGQFIKARALIDSGSQWNFVTKEMAQILGIRRKKMHCSVGTIGCGSESANEVVTLDIKSCNTNYQTTIEAAILTHITDNLPDHMIESSSLQIPTNITLADPRFTHPERIDILLGKSIEVEIRLPGKIQLTTTGPYLENTLFGWLAGGNVNETIRYSTFRKIAGCAISNQTTDDFDMKKFWELEEVNSNEIRLSVEEQFCEEIFANSIKQRPDGFYEVSLPFRDNKSNLGNSKGVAIRRLDGLIKRLQRTPQIYGMYSDFLNEYKQLGHMVKISDQDMHLIKSYIPHQHVLRPSSSTTKLRVVFDASVKTSSGLSLNDTLMVGPVVQSDLFSILCRYRLYSVVFSADVEKMYRQIRITDADTYYQCILWQHQDQKQIEAYRLLTVTYGTSSAPYLATKTLAYLADTISTKYPLAAQTIRENTYVDDILAGGNSLEEAITKRNQLIKTFKSCNMNLRKWSSNSEQFLTDIPPNERESLVQIGDKSILKTLGMAFKPQTDCFTYSIAIDVERIITKRTIISDIARIYDPLGLVSPIATSAKIILQKLWLLKLNWDEEPPKDLVKEWNLLRQELNYINNYEIPRQIKIAGEINSIQLHGFSDASEAAYGACIYLRSVNTSNEVATHLICSKSKVTPIQPVISLPRLELCAFELLCRLVRKLQSSLNINFDKIHLWTDATITLGWITTQASQYKSFVANRVGKIHEIIKSDIFTCHYVPGKENPADIVSRGCNPKKLITESKWFHGPPFLQLNETQWPKKPNINRKTLPDIRKQKYSLHVSNCIDLTQTIHVKFRHSFTKLTRIFGYVHRFIANITKKSRFKSQPQDLIGAIYLISYTIQQSHYRKEINSLEQNESISSKSPIKPLAPFVDDNKLLRVGGRLRNSNLHSDEKHQLLLPNNHYVTNAIFRYYHIKHLHCGPQALLTSVRSQFWVVGGKNIAKKTVWSCTICFFAKPRSINPFMGDLPSARLLPGSPFSSTCVDYACGLQAHQKGRGSRPFKVYVCVFVCMKTRAIHLELVSELSTRAFIAALRRMIGRRGIVSDLYCDNGTNFVGAKSELLNLEKLFFEEKHQQNVTHYCTENHINVHFCPPKGPHFNGLAEAGVKSFKHHLIRVTGQAHLNYEELNTLIIQIESILNSRPITEISTDPNDLEALTPGHFLIGRPLTSFPEPQSDWKGSLHQYNRICDISKHFWNRWKHEYLNTLQQRTKWNHKSPNLQMGQLVIVKQDNTPPLFWPIGRIVKLTAGHDNIVRVVSVKTSSGIYDRPSVKICPLPFSTD